MNKIEQTLSIIKPDAVERNLIENIKDILKTIISKLKSSKNTYYQRGGCRIL